jgi:hypothetical protein
LLVTWLLGSLAAEAQTEIVLFERAPLRPGLCAALRIQLSGSAEVGCLPDGASASLAERLAGTRARLRDASATLGVLLERDSDPHLLRMYLVTAEGEQATLAIERIEDRPEPDVDRSLALKVRDAYEVIAFVDRTLPDSPASAAAVLVGPKAVPTTSVVPLSAASAPQDSSWLAFVDLGGGLSLGDSARGLGNMLAGVGHTARRVRYEVGLGARMVSRQSEHTILGKVSVAERGPLLSARVLWRWERLELGAASHLFIAFSAAEGTTADGVSGKERVVSAVLGLGPDLRLSLFRSAYLRFAPSLELWTTRQRFALDHQVLIDHGRVAASLPLSLVISLPLAKTSEGFQP